MLLITTLLLLSGMQVNAETIEISLEEMVGLALEESIDFKIAHLEWQQAQLSYEKALADNLLTQSAYNQRLAELNLMKAEGAYKKSMAGVVINAVRRFSDVELARQDICIKELRLQQSSKAEELVLRKAAARSASEFDVLEAKVNLAKSQFDLQRSKDSLAEQVQALNIMLASEKYIGDGKLHFVSSDIKLSDVLNTVLESSPAIQEAEDNLEIAVMDLDRLLLDETPKLVLSEAQNKVDLAKLRLEQTRGNITQEILAAYNGVTNALGSFEASESAYELQFKQFGVMEGQVAAGLKTEDDLLGAKIALLEAERSIYETLSGYITACLQLDEVSGGDVKQRLNNMTEASDD